jgi:hypothetical protein
MPQASRASQELMNRWFGHPVADYGPMKFLQMRGWIFTRGGMIEPPVSAHNPSVYELACIDFLCDEWDYGYRGRPWL